MKKNTALSIAVLSIAMVGCSTSKSGLGITGTNIVFEHVNAKKAELTENELKRWSHLDIQKDTIPGMSVDKAYAELIKDKKGKEVIVAVVDSGLDVNHEDLNGVLWINQKEIPGNGIDDDKNGFIDDVYGWNFLGNIVNESLEMARIIREGDKNSEDYKNAQSQIAKKSERALANKKQLDFMLDADKKLREFLKKDNYTKEDIDGIQTDVLEVNQAKMLFSQILASTTKAEFDAQMKDFKDYVDSQLNYHLNTEFDGRKEVLGDDHNSMNNTIYGNADVLGPVANEAMHGTHVSGIIAQVRGNGIGGDGVAADNVKIMTLRAVPNGDEYDKDIALSIRYAVDNGAKVINGSFGKGFSPKKQWVYDALKYAQEHDVLFVHAAGNDAENSDEVPNFPNDGSPDQELFSNFLNIGALNYQIGTNLLASFTNYGKESVDIFAPGVKIYATTPLNNYEYQQGTSMASPNAAGVAAVIRSYYPQLSAKQVKQIIMESGVQIPIEVQIPGKPGTRVNAKEISRTGKIVNLYNALLLAERMTTK